MGLLYHGEGRTELLTMLYLAVAVETPALVPEAGGLAWVAEMAEETAVDMECAELDRAARSMLENDTSTLWPRLTEALSSASSSHDPHLRETATHLAETPSRWSGIRPFDGVRQILDALLMVAEDGHAPGTRVRALAGPHRGRTATILSAVWGAAGPPIAYRIQLDGTTTTLGMAAGELVVLADQESLHA